MAPTQHSQTISVIQAFQSVPFLMIVSGSSRFIGSATCGVQVEAVER